ncbi:MAG: hypothetical protein EXS14_02355 [Planctomycetes bacterium]|nr:hypothetical protein [Planctomycetota bacterium]
MSRRRALLFALTFLAVLLALDALLLLSTRNLRVMLDRTLADALGGELSYGELSGDVREGLELSDVRLLRGGDPAAEFALVRRMRVTPALLGPLFGRPVVSSVELEGVQLTLAFAPDGRLLLPEILRTDSSSAETPQLPRVHVRGLEVRIVDAPYLVKRDVRVPLSDLDFDLAATRPGARSFGFRASLNSPVLGALQARGTIGGGAFDVEVTRDGLALSPQLAELLSPQFALIVGGLDLGGAATITGRLRTALGQGGESRVVFTGGVALSGARAGFRGWPIGLEELHGSIAYEDGVLTIAEMAPLGGLLAGAPFSARGAVHLDQAVPLVAIRGHLNGLSLDDALVERIRAMPGPGQEIARQLSIFRMRGRLDMDWRVGERPGTRAAGIFALQPEMDMVLSDGEFSYVGTFAYPFHAFGGNLLVTDLGLKSTTLHARDGALELQASVEVDYRKKGEETYSVQALARHMPLDEKLLSVLSESLRNTMSTLELSGELDLSVHAEHRSGQLEAPPVQLVIEPGGMNMRPAFFPWALSDVRGRVMPQGDALALEGVTARHGAGTLRLEGLVGLESRAGHLDVSIVGRDVPLDEDLFAALEHVAPGAGAALRRIGMSGAVHINLRLQGEAGSTRPALSGSLQLDRARVAPPGMGLALDKVTGWLDLADGPARHELVFLPGASAFFCGRALRLSGGCDFAKGYEFVLESDSMDVDSALLRALSGVVPSFGEDTTRPFLEGLASPRVVIAGEGSNTQWRVETALHGMSFAMPAWKGTRLVEAAGTLSASSAGVSLERLVAVLERPSNLAPLPQLTDPTGTRPFSAERKTSLSAAHVTVMEVVGGVSVMLQDVSFRDLPLEPWILGLGGREDSQRDAAWPAGLTGVTDIDVQSARFLPEGFELGGGRARLRSVGLGREASFSMDAADIADFNIQTLRGTLTFRGGLRARNAKLLRLPIPLLEGVLVGDDSGFSIDPLGGVIFGYSLDRFDAMTAALDDVRARAVENGWLDAAQAAEAQEREVRALVQARETLDVSNMAHADLVTLVRERSLAPEALAKRLSVAELRSMLERGRDSRPLGVLLEEGTKLRIGWGGEFELKLALAEVAVGSAIDILGGESGEVRGRMKGSLELAGMLANPEDWTGGGVLHADVWNAIHLPLMLGVLKAVDVTALFSDSRRARVQAAFRVAKARLDFHSARVKSAGLTLDLTPPGSVSFDGSVDLGFAVSHGGGVPLISDILGFLPSLLLDTIRVRGTLEQPEVEGGSAALGSGR